MWLCFEIVLNFLEIHMELFVGEMITGERKRVGVEIQWVWPGLAESKLGNKDMRVQFNIFYFCVCLKVSKSFVRAQTVHVTGSSGRLVKSALLSPTPSFWFSSVGWSLRIFSPHKFPGNAAAAPSRTPYGEWLSWEIESQTNHISGPQNPSQSWTGNERLFWTVVLPPLWVQDPLEKPKARNLLPQKCAHTYTHMCIWFGGLVTPSSLHT